MRIRLILPALLLLSLPAAAQVSVDQRALDNLPAAPAKPGSAPAAKPATAPKVQHPPQPAKPAAPAASNTTVRPIPGAPPLPPIATAPPPAPVLPPAIAVPTRPAAPAAPASVSADAPTSIAPLPGGMRVVFGAGRADLNPASEASVRALVHGGGTVAAAPDGSSFTITSFAAGTPEDPSTPRRLSLSRALTLRSVLISQGVASVRIYVRALGPTSTGFADGPADRADIIVAANPVPAPAPVQSR